MPKSLKEAIDYLDEYGKDAAVMAGGTDLVVMMNGGLKTEYVLSLTDIPDLDYVQLRNPRSWREVGTGRTGRAS
ncbi:MAG: FAD binding domain-containing protein [Deltaproteobacteria bacterium]|nr:FAD binding domain-containing protein [Deltaproteobacteria bacterium]